MDDRSTGAQEVSYIGNRAEHANDIFSAQTDLLVSQYYDTLLHRPECITEELLQTLEVNGVIFGDDDAAVLAMVYSLEESAVSDGSQAPRNRRYDLLQEAVHKSLNRKCIHYCFPADGWLTCLVSFPRLKTTPVMHQQNIITMLYLSAEELKQELEPVLQSRVSVAIGNLIYGVSQIPASYASATDLLQYNSFLETSDYDILMAPTPEVLNRAVDEISSANLALYRMITSAGAGVELNKLRPLFDRAIEAAVAYSAHSLRQFQKNVFSVLQAVISNLIGAGHIPATFSEESDILYRMINAPTRRELGQIIDDLWQLLEQYHTIQQPAAQPDKVDAIKRYLDENYADFNISVAALAEMAGMSQPTLSIQFKKRCGVSLTDYITELRLGRAKQLIQNTELSIAQIAAQAGFGSLPSIYRAFRKYENISPGQLRQK